jgi:hypothetical protein
MNQANRDSDHGRRGTPQDYSRLMGPSRPWSLSVSARGALAQLGERKAGSIFTASLDSPHRSSTIRRQSAGSNVPQHGRGLPAFVGSTNLAAMVSGASPSPLLSTAVGPERCGNSGHPSFPRGLRPRESGQLGRESGLVRFPDAEPMTPSLRSPYRQGTPSHRLPCDSRQGKPHLTGHRDPSGRNGSRTAARLSPRIPPLSRGQRPQPPTNRDGSRSGTDAGPGTCGIGRIGGGVEGHAGESPAAPSGSPCNRAAEPTGKAGAGVVGAPECAMVGRPANQRNRPRLDDIAGKATRPADPSSPEVTA